jgi:gluconate:H+ symporter, GntP family
MSAEFLRLIIGLIISIGALIYLNRYFRLHAFICLLIAAIVLGLITGISLSRIVDAMQTGFGSLLGQI